ncbi:uncharacterized protein LOC134824287 isoform X2 [Bolinopsis microptera]|uniref:uncharacterized protein LOC134824287 isoform X2 n=1 Tax=Bolinopsis microptera TaxID=2820187 RepID=UPI00307AC9D9
MKFTFRSPVRSGSGSSGSPSRYGSTKSSGYGTTSSGYGSSSGYGGYTGSTGTSSYDSSYTPSSSRTPTYGSGVGGYGSSNYSSSYGTSNYSAGTGYGGSSAIGRSSARDYDAGSNANNAYTSSAYTSRASRDRSSERSLDNIYTPRASRRSSGNSTSDYYRTGLRKSSSYSGLHWAREAEKKEHKVVNVNDMIYKSHRRNGSNTSINSDVFEETKPGITRSRESSLRTKPAKRDLEAILGKEDHMLVQRIIEENKAIIEDAHAKLTSQEEKLIKKIMEVSMTGNSIDCLDILTIIESC